MQMPETFKKCRASIYWRKKFYCLYIRQYIFVFAWANCGSDIIVIYDVIEH